MKRRKKEETKAIIDTLLLLEQAPFLRNEKNYIQSECNGRVFEFMFEQSDWCWIVWKPADSDKNQKYKVIPRVHIRDIEAILNAQHWTCL